MKVLVVDDDDFFRKFYANKLTETGFEVEVASDGEEGLRKIRQQKPDIVLLDMVMPKKDGFALLQDLASDSQVSNIPVLVFSSLNQKEDLTKIQGLGAKGYVDKSTQDYNSLLAKIFEITKPGS